MLTTLLIWSVSSYIALVSASPALRVETEDAPSGHLDRTWEVIIAVVFSVVIAAVIGIAIYYKIRAKRRQRDAEARRSRRSSAEHTRSRPVRTIYSKQDVIPQPVPVLIYDREKRSSSSYPRPSD